VDPENAKKLGQFAGLDTIVIGTITPLSGTIRVTVKVLATDSAKLLGAASADIPKTNSIRAVMGEPEIPEPTPSQSAPRAELVPPHAPTGSDEVEPNLNPPPQPSPHVPERQLPQVEAYAFIVAIEAALSAHDWRTITSFTQDEQVNYFGHRDSSNAYIIRDMENDASMYSWSHNHINSICTRCISPFSWSPTFQVCGLLLLCTLGFSLTLTYKYAGTHPPSHQTGLT
jgi:hypothetical protein